MNAVTAIKFPVGYHSLHPDVSMNFQMNRWYGCVGEPEMLEEMRTVAPRIATYTDWKREFVALAERASKNGHHLRSGFYWRSAEFFMMIDDPDRKNAREKFLGAIRSVYGADLGDRYEVPTPTATSADFSLLTGSNRRAPKARLSSSAASTALSRSGPR